jgi:hypothetical protein
MHMEEINLHSQTSWNMNTFHVSNTIRHNRLQMVVSKVWVTLRLTVSQPVTMSWCWAHSATCDRILLPVGRLLSDNCILVSAGCPVWRENESAVCSAITQWSESSRTHNHTLLSHLRPPIWRARFTYPPRCPVIPPGTGFFLRRLLRLAGLRWRYSNPPPTWRARSRIYIYAPGTGWSSPKSKVTLWPTVS